MWRCFWTGVRFPSPPPIKSTYDENPRNSRVFCYAWATLAEVATTLQMMKEDSFSMFNTTKWAGRIVKEIIDR